MAGVSSKSWCRGFLAASVLTISLFLFSSYSIGAYSPVIRFEVPVKDASTNDLGLFARNGSFGLDFNLTFDYAFPLGENETNVTAEIWDGGGMINSRTIAIKTYLEKYGITKNGNYVFKPIYFNFSADVTGRNVSSTPITLDYTVYQYGRKPYPNEGDGKWKLWGRYITGKDGASLANEYCSGSEDFTGEGNGQNFECDTGTLIEIQKGSYDDKLGGTDGQTKSYQSTGPILYFVPGGANDKIPSTPGGSAFTSEWRSEFSWKFETFVYPTIDSSGEFNIYSDNGVEVDIIDLDGGSPPKITPCLHKSPITTTGPCEMSYSFSKNRWYKIDVYLYNNPGGDSSSNPAGVRIEKKGSGEMSLMRLIGGEGAVINSAPPGSDNVPITDTETIYAGGQEGLFDVRDFTMFSTDHANAECGSQSVSCSLRMACGSSTYTDLSTNKYGWILNYQIHPENWAMVGGIPKDKEGSITNKAGAKIDFDRTSIEDGYLRAQYTASSGYERPIGGIYRCKESDNWPYWEMECADENRRYNYTEGLKTYKCCYVEPQITAHYTGAYGSTPVEKDYTVRIDYKSNYRYIINFLPPYGNVGDKLCAIPNPTMFESYPIQTLYSSNYTNQFCNPNTGTRCCYCRSGWGCRLDCANEFNSSASSKFTLPFPLSYKQLWSLRDVSLGFEGSADAVELTAKGNSTDGWSINAKLSDSANLILDKVYAVPLNLFSDFGLRAPDATGAYTLVLKVNSKNASGRVQSPTYSFHVSDCTLEGSKRSFYDEAAYPGTKGTGICRPGLQVCTKVAENDFRWRYESKDDMPVYPSVETCNGIDDDCNGIVDDVNGFDWIMDQVISSGGKMTPYQVTRCGCFMGSAPKDEKCNGIDDDCDGVVDNPQANVWVNTCDSAVASCIDQGSPYEWCKKLYNSTSCSLAQVAISETGNATVNTCTERVRACMNNVHVSYSGDTLVMAGSFTYNECKSFYNNYSCFLEERDAAILGDTCGCSNNGAPRPETCNGIDDDCNGKIDDVANANTCGCTMLTNVTLIHRLKSGGDASCNGIDDNCNGMIDEGASNCACTGKSPADALSIKTNANEMCNGIDDNCNGLIDENFPQLGKPCGLGVCAGGTYVCNAFGNDSVCNTTVNIPGRATKRSSPEICDLIDNNCDGSIDEGCACTPIGAVKLCGYQNGIYYKNRGQISQTCNQVVEQIRNLLNQASATSEDIYEKCTTMLGNVSSFNSSITGTILSLCDSIRICNKTDFPVNAISECAFGMQTCNGGQWGNCSAVMPRTETCNGKDNDCNGIISDVAVPATCACYNGTHAPGELREACNGIDDNCNGIMDDVNGGNSVNSSHCGCFDQIVNITQRVAQTEIGCNAVDDNCNGVVDEGVDNCACKGTLFGPYNNTLSQAISGERCNGIDDDCNGIIDDPWQQGGSSASGSQYLGAICGPLNSRCSGGAYVCSKRGNGIVCSTSSNDGTSGRNLAIGETCNGIDDDCNGVIDDVAGNDSGRLCQCYNGVPTSSEVCDGKDNDCNGLVDDGLAGCGCSFDMRVNASNVNQLSALLGVKKASSEICNNIDDNCNGQVDEGLGGACFCSGNFTGNPAMRPEFCNGVDDDCNGIIDDVANNGTCACYNGAHKSGELNETCNGIDDNCNGLIDENWPNLGASCGLGVCAGGVYECSADGKGNVCSTGPGGSNNKAGEEVCDGIDNDCNGAIDEGCACDAVGTTRKCGTNAGECREGVQTCTANGWSACIGGVFPSPEICDGKDNNCDGVVDNVPNPSTCACANGAHQPGDLQETCNGVDDDCNGIVDDASGGNSVASTKCGCFKNAYAKGAKVETCNGIDDDCNGAIDDVKGGNSAASTKCACYGGASPGAEKCNGIDDDCNGLIDETWTTLGQTCGQGICTGVLVCSSDGASAQCNGAQPQTEVCDGKDNNCNGQIDEGCFGSQPGQTSCQNGVKDGDETGVDCGGSCQTPCKQPPTLPAGSWVFVFAVLVVIIVIVGVVLLFLKPSKPL